MRCESIKTMMNDLLDKTLSAGEEREVEDHLARCESCRNEFHKLKRADDILREVVCEMVSEIEVPPELSHRIEKIVVREQRKKSLAGRLPVFLKNPAFAAALLFTVITAVILSYLNPFSLAEKHSEVVFSEPQALSGPKGGNMADSSGPPVMREEVRAVAEPETSKKNETHTIKETAVAGDTGGTPEVVLKDQPSPMTARVPQVVGKLPPPQENRSLAATGAPALKKGTLEEAAGEVGFNPARPAYLPRGAVLQEVTWLSGTVYQNYRAGQISFTISQNRTDMVKFNDDEGVRQGTFTEINGSRAILHETGPEVGDNASRRITTVRWQWGEWIFSVSGELPREEIIKIASSLK